MVYVPASHLSFRGGGGVDVFLEQPLPYAHCSLLQVVLECFEFF